MIKFTPHILPSTAAAMDRMVNVYGEANQFRYTDQGKYRALLDAYFEEETLRRLNLIRAVGNDKMKIARTCEFMSFRENLINVMVDWCWTYDPRLLNQGLPTTIPWIPWQRQVDFIAWFYDHYLNSRGGLIEKSRDQGATWLACLCFLHEWRWNAGFGGGFGSNKSESVDKRGNPKSIFEKLRALARHMPEWWFPRGWQWKKHDKNYNLINPENGANISGEGGDEIGRGGRTSAYLVDEAGFLDKPKSADAALSQNTTCHFDLSTPNGMNNFGQKRHSGRVDVFTFRWTEDPRKDQQWYDEQVATFDPSIVASEIDINYEASVEGIFIKSEWVSAAMEIKLDPIGVKAAALDVAAGGANKSALAIRTGPCAYVESKNVTNGVDLVHGVIARCNVEGVSYLHYDRIGVGYAVYSVIERTEAQMKFSQDRKSVV